MRNMDRILRHYNTGDIAGALGYARENGRGRLLGGKMGHDEES